MKRVTVLILVGLLLLGACDLEGVRGSGDLVTENRSVGGFDRVTATTSGELIVTQGERESLSIETDDNIIDHITSEVQNGTLTLGKDDPMAALSPSQLIFRLTVTDLAGLKVTGSVDVTAASLAADQIDITVTGSGGVRIGSLTAEQLRIRITGSGDVELAGQVASQILTLSSSGKYQGADLESVDAELTMTGSGGATLWATGSLTGRVSGSGSATYYGDPDVDISTTGSGGLVDRGPK